MSDPKGQHEPSMEEILASIRRIIAEDGDGGAAEEKPGRGEEVLELTEVVEEDGSVVSLTAGPKKAILEPPPPAAVPTPPPAPPPKRAAAPEPVFAVEKEAAPPPAPRPAPPPPPPALAAAPAADQGLVSTATQAASVSALAQLTAIPPPRDPFGSMPLGNSSRTVEDLIRDMLTPMLKQWLDSNLAPLVERLVQEEIQRMSRQAQGR